MAAQLNNSTINTGQPKLFHESGKALKKTLYYVSLHSIFNGKK